MHAPHRRLYSPVLLVTLATVPLMLAAVSVWMMRDAWSGKALATMASPTPPSPITAITP